MIVESPPKTIIEQTLDLWDIDAKIDNTDPDKELLKIPQLHAKYARLLTKHSLLARKYELDLVALKRSKSDYYNGRLSAAELNEKGLSPFKFILKGESHDYIAADKEVIALQLKKHMHDEMISLCTSILKELHSRTFQLRTYCEWQRFIGGQ